MSRSTDRSDLGPPLSELLQEADTHIYSLHRIADALRRRAEVLSKTADTVDLVQLEERAGAIAAMQHVHSELQKLVGIVAKSGSAAEMAHKAEIAAAREGLARASEGTALRADSSILRVSAGILRVSAGALRESARPLRAHAPSPLAHAPSPLAHAPSPLAHAPWASPERLTYNVEAFGRRPRGVRQR